jgi:hypothetical protein
MPTLGETLLRHLKEPGHSAKEMEWPPLTGSEKQVPWATEIRQFRIGQAHRNQIASREQDVMEFLPSIHSAHWWIETRGLPYASFMQAVMDQFAKCRFLMPSKTDEMADMALAEATMVPPALRGPVTEVSISSNTVMVLLIEFDEDVNKLLKRFRFHWEAPAWVRTVAEDVAENRAIEIAVRLLAHGCPVRIFDEALRQRTVENAYEPESPRRVEVSTSAKYSTKFHLVWTLDEKPVQCKKAAQQLRGAKVFDDGAYVSASHFEEIQDFASQNGFTITPEAQSLIESEKGKLAGSVKVAARPKAAAVIPLKPALATANGEIDAELLDD